jgi:hypothetical protein
VQETKVGVADGQLHFLASGIDVEVKIKVTLEQVTKAQR